MNISVGDLARALDGEAEVLGSPYADLLGLDDGDYILDLRLTQDARGPQAHNMMFRIEIVNGIIAMTQNNADGRGWTDREPNVMRVQTDDDEALLLTFDQRVSDGFGIIRIDASGNGAPRVEYWWNRRDRRPR